MNFVLAPADNVVNKCCGCLNDLCLFGLMLNVSVNTYGDLPGRSVHPTTLLLPGQA